MIPTFISRYTVESYLKHDYYQKIYPYIKNKKVLDVGCVDDNIDLANQKRLWNHWFIYRAAKQTLGIDIEKKSIDKMKRMDFNVKTMSAEKMSFENEFDTVFAGELIEHLINPGLFLKKAKKALRKNGKIVLSTPNTYSVNRLARVFLLHTNEPPVNIDHTTYFTPQTISTLARKCGLKVSKFDYAYFPFTQISHLARINKIACSFLGERFKEQLIAVIQ